ncbi:hypothetical protein ACFPVT_10055 [Corynebacterium choanae]|nr:hypothetical protein [Corynebacterium choanae]
MVNTIDAETLCEALQHTISNRKYQQQLRQPTPLLAHGKQRARGAARVLR